MQDNGCGGRRIWRENVSGIEPAGKDMAGK